MCCTRDAPRWPPSTVGGWSQVVCLTAHPRREEGSPKGEVHQGVPGGLGSYCVQAPAGSR